MNKNLLSKVDYTLVLIIFILACISFISIANAPLESGGRATELAYKQIGWYTFSAVAAFLVMLADYDQFKQMHWIFYALGLILLLGLTFAQLGVPVPLANTTNGAWSWYNIPAVGAIQPSEFMKLFLIVSLGSTIDRHHELYPIRGRYEDLLLLGKMALVSFPPLLLVFIQPDLGTALVMFSIILSMIIVSGIGWKWIAGIVAAIGSGLAFFVVCWIKFPAVIDLILKAHQKDRFLAWTNPYQYQNQEGYQLIQSLNSIGSGEFFNHSFNTSITLPEAYNDFIFAIIGGSFGFIGSVVVILLYFIMIYQMIQTAIRTHDPFGSYICTGIVGMIMFQVFENIGMTIQLMPVTGITLPFLSYGGSSLLSSMIAVGLVQSVRMRTQTYMFT